MIDVALAISLVVAIALAVELHLRRRRLEAAIDDISQAAVLDLATDLLLPEAYERRIAIEAGRTQRESGRLLLVEFPRADPHALPDPTELAFTLGPGKVGGFLRSGGVGIMVLSPSGSEDVEIVESRVAAVGVDVRDRRERWYSPNPGAEVGG